MQQQGLGFTETSVDETTSKKAIIENVKTASDKNSMHEKAKPKKKMKVANFLPPAAETEDVTTKRVVTDIEEMKHENFKTKAKKYGGMSTLVEHWIDCFLDSEL